MSEPTPAAVRTRSLGWGRVLQGGRLVPAFAVVAVASLLLGLVLARFVQPPGSGTSASVLAGFITAPVERKTLRNEVITRADATFADAVKIDAPTALAGSAVVSGRLPVVGAHVAALDVVAEVSGRPIILLPGSIPAYRTLSFGMSGADVVQLKHALLQVGIDPGNPDAALYDAKTAAAVGALYQRVGYAPAGADPASADQLRSARDAVVNAQDGLDAANRALTKARNALTPAGRLDQDARVSSAQRAEQAAQRALATAQVALSAANAAVASAAPADLAEARAKQSAASNAAADSADALANAHDATTLAIADRAAALANPDTSDEAAAVVSAQHALDSARATLASVSNAALPTLPAGEVAFVAQLPRRVDSVTAVLGAPASGPLLTLSGADLALVASVSPADASLLAVGDQATFEPASGGAEITARVTSIGVQSNGGTSGADSSGADASGAGASGSGAASSGGATSGSAGSSSTSSNRMSVTLAPVGLTDAQVRALDGSNVRVVIPVGATAGDVLAVPISAVSVGPGGSSRVQLVDGHGRASFVEVTTGLVAQGQVEISSTTGALKAGDKVVVGK